MNSLVVSRRAPLQTTRQSARRNLGHPGQTAGLGVESPKLATLLSGTYQLVAFAAFATFFTFVMVVIGVPAGTIEQHGALGEVPVGTFRVGAVVVSGNDEPGHVEAVAHVPGVIRQAPCAPHDRASGQVQGDDGIEMVVRTHASRRAAARIDAVLHRIGYPIIVARSPVRHVAVQVNGSRTAPDGTAIVSLRHG